jgi:HD superfamily phosphohydrolase
MYWQVYIHKTTVGIEKMLIQIIRRIRGLKGKIQLSPELDLFINNTITPQMIEEDKSILQAFCYLDDYDILGGIKRWYHSKDLVLSQICSMLLERKLFNVRLSETKLDRNELMKLKERVKLSYRIDDNLVKHLVVEGTKSNSAYIGGGQQINMITKAGKIVDIAKASDLPNIKAMQKIVKKYYLCWPKNISLQP